MSHQQCTLCRSEHVFRLDVRNQRFRNQSHSPAFHRYENFYCEGCGVVFMSPCPEPARLKEYYNGEYRRSSYAVSLGESKFLEVPIQIPWSGVSFKRFQIFYDMISSEPDLGTPQPEDVFIDFGGYQGFFAGAVRKVFGCRCLNYDYNEEGVRFSEVFGVRGVVGKDICQDMIEEKASWVSLVHVFEHIEHPLQFLRHLKANIMEKNKGVLYIEVPNVYACPLSDPTHVFMYSAGSLENILKLAGFRVVAMKIHGNGCPEYFTSQEANISCLAVPDEASPAENAFLVKKREDFEKDLRRSYDKIAVQNSLTRAASGLKAFLKESLMVLIIFAQRWIPRGRFPELAGTRRSQVAKGESM